ncbi:MAG: hypothetical protein JWP57_2944, partial [Spirosoma sp.]|nr:hypothetical protein [Spirosoma sp.]
FEVVFVSDLNNELIVDYFGRYHWLFLIGC